MNELGYSLQSNVGCSVLPVELCYILIDFVAIAQRERETTLAACALVCRAWLPCARAHLFHSVTLRNFHEYDQFSESLRSNPELSSLVRILHFNIHGSAVDTNYQDRTLPVSLLAELPSLESVSYYSWLTAQTLRLRLEIASLPRVPSVTNFTINICVFRKFSDMVLLLGTFPNLRKLRLYEVIFIEHDVLSPNLNPSPHLPLRSLHIGSLREASPVLDWLVDSASATCLKRVSVGLDTRDSQAIFTRFLRFCGASIRHLSVRIRAMGPSEAQYGKHKRAFIYLPTSSSQMTDDMDLVHNPQRRSISFHIRSMQEIHALPKPLSTISSGGLTKISVRLDPAAFWSTTYGAAQTTYVLDRQPEKCATFDHLLSSHLFPSLASVIFDVPASLRPSLLCSLNHTMPLLSARKLIQVI